MKEFTAISSTADSDFHLNLTFAVLDELDEQILFTLKHYHIKLKPMVEAK